MTKSCHAGIAILDISMENTPVQSPAVLGWRAKEVKVPDTCGPFARQITENSPQMPRYVPARGGGGGAGVYIDWCIAAVSCPLDDHRNQQLINEGKFISSLTCNTSGSRKPTAVTRSSKHFGKKK